jgi:hypothetical protein
MTVASGLRSSAIGPLALIFAAVCLVPAAVLASFGLAFTVLDVPVEP